MEKVKKIFGKCLCKSVTIEIEKAPEIFSTCHCLDCRKWSGGAAMNFNAGQHLKFSNEDLVGRYSSSEWGERGFCKKCGTSLFYRLKKTDHYFLYLGLFDDAISPKFDLQEFVDEKPDYYEFANHTKTITKAESFAKLKEYLAKP